MKKILQWMKSKDLSYWQNVCLVAFVIAFVFWLVALNIVIWLALH